MEKQVTRHHYQRRFQVLIDYIYQNLEGDLSLETMAEVACISPYHLHRLYRSLYGETLAEAVRRIRLHYAADGLLRSSDGIDRIAIRSGYSSVQSFNRAFKNLFGMPPAAFRGQSDVQKPGLPESCTVEGNFQVRIERMAPMSVWGMPHRGAFLGIGKTFESLFGWIAANQKWSVASRMCGIYWGDPDSLEEEQLHSLAGFICSTEEHFSELECHHLPAGEYAVLRFIGPYNHLHEAYLWLFNQWLPDSGYSPGYAPVLEEYLNNPREVPPAELQTDIYLAITAE